MIAGCDNPSVPQHKHAVGVTDRLGAVSDRDDRMVQLVEFGDAGCNPVFRFGIELACHFVQEYDRRFMIECAS